MGAAVGRSVLRTGVANRGAAGGLDGRSGKGAGGRMGLAGEAAGGLKMRDGLSVW